MIMGFYNINYLCSYVIHPLNILYPFFQKMMKYTKYTLVKCTFDF